MIAPLRRTALCQGAVEKRIMDGNGMSPREAAMHDRPVQDIVQRTATLRCAPADLVAMAAHSMAEAGCGSILVCEGDRLTGIFTERDLLCRVVAKGLDPKKTTVGQVMTVNPCTIAPEAPIREAIRVMDEGSFRYLPVCRAGKLVAVISAKDLPYEEIGRMARALEQEHVIAERLW